MDIDTTTGLETKAGIPLDAVVTHGEMMRAFEAFKEANDEQLDKRDADVVLEEKLARINSTIDAQAHIFVPTDEKLSVRGSVGLKE